MNVRILPALLLVAACGASAPEIPSDEEPGETGGAVRTADAAVDGRAASGGAAGQKGTGGSAGQPGSGGSAGQPGSGGSAGQPGSGGSAGQPGSGGSAGQPGTGGSAVDGGPPIVATPCTSLGGVNVWEKIGSLSLGGMGVLAALIDPRDRASIYATVDKRGIHRSTDCGATWTKMNTGRNASVIDSGSQWVFVIDQVDGNVMYTSPLYGSDLRLFKSTNAGVDWDPIFAKGGNVEQALDYMFTEIFSIDTADHNHLVVNFHVNCKAPYTPMCLAETYDAGATWQILDGPPSMGGWLEDAGPVVIDGAIYLGVPFDGLFRSADHGKTWNKVAPGGYFEIYHSTNGYYYMGAAQQSLQRSRDLQSWSALANTPTTVSNAIIGDGERIFAAARNFEMYVASPEADGATFTKIAAPSGAGGAKMFAYDSVNHLLYSANNERGLFRMVTH